MKKYKMVFRVHKECGGGYREIEVECEEDSQAITVAAMILDDEGIDRWSLVSFEGRAP